MMIDKHYLINYISKNENYNKYNPQIISGFIHFLNYIDGDGRTKTEIINFLMMSGRLIRELHMTEDEQGEDYGYLVESTRGIRLFVRDYYNSEVFSLVYQLINDIGDGED